MLENHLRVVLVASLVITLLSHLEDRAGCFTGVRYDDIVYVCVVDDVCNMPILRLDALLSLLNRWWAPATQSEPLAV